MVHVDEGVPCIVGERVGVGHRVILHGCVVEPNCLIGMGSTLLNGVVIGEGSVVAAGAVIPEGMRVPPGSLVMGVPGRIVRPVDAALRRRIEGTWSHYVDAGAGPSRRPLPARFAYRGLRLELPSAFHVFHIVNPDYFCDVGRKIARSRAGFSRYCAPWRVGPSLAIRFAVPVPQHEGSLLFHFASGE